MTRLRFSAYGVLVMLLLSAWGSPSSQVVLATQEKVIYDVCFSKHGSVLLVADGPDIRWFSGDSFSILGVSKGHTKQLLAIDLAADSSILASGGKDSTLILWDVKQNTIRKRLNFHRGIITSLALSPDNRYVVSGDTDDKVYLYDIQEQKIQHVFADHADDVTSVAFSPDGTLICTAGADGTINFYEASTRKLIESFRNQGFIREVSFYNDGTGMIACGDNSKVNVWRIHTDKIIQLRTLEDESGWLLTAKMLEDNKTLVTGGLLGKVKIMTGNLTYEQKLAVPLSRIEFKPFNDPYLQVAVATLGKGVIILDARNMKTK